MPHRSAAIIKLQVAADRCAGLADVVAGIEINLLVFDAAPQPLDEHIVPPSPFAVHADRNAVVGEQAGEGRARELRTLIRIKDVRLAVTSQDNFRLVLASLKILLRLTLDALRSAKMTRPVFKFFLTDD